MTKIESRQTSCLGYSAPKRDEDATPAKCARTYRSTRGQGHYGTFTTRVHTPRPPSTPPPKKSYSALNV